MADNKTLYFDTSISNNNTSVEPDENAANTSSVRQGYAFKNVNTKEQLVGTMPDNDPLEIALEPQNEEKTNFSSYIIPKGYHDGTGKVYVGYLKEYTEGNAIEEEIAEGKVAWVNGIRIVGTLDISQAKQEANATENDIAYGKYAWANGKKILGNIPVLGREDKLISAGDKYTVPYGITPKDGIIITAKPLNIQTVGSATASDITKDKVAWVNGVKITGTFDKESQIKQWAQEANATKDKVLAGYTFFAKEYMTTAEGTMEDHTGEDTRILKPGDLFNIPEGYYDGNVSIKVQDIQDATIASALPSEIIKDKTAWVNGVKVTGTMEYNDTFTEIISADEEYTIQEGYHTGNSIIKAESLDTQTKADAEAKNILEGKTAWVNGVKLTGTMEDAGPISIILDAGEHYHIPGGYHDGAGNVYAKSLGESTKGSALASDILYGRTAWVNGVKVTGIMNDNPGTWIELDPGSMYMIPKGYHTGNGAILAKGIKEGTTGTATAEDILKDKTAWVNGVKLTGTVELTGDANPAQVLAGYTFYNTDTHTKLTGLLSLDGNALESQVMKGATFYTDDPTVVHTGTMELTGDAISNAVVEGYTFYSDDPSNKLIGSMPSNPPVDVTLKCSESYEIPTGYHKQNSIVRADTLLNQTQATASAGDILEGKTAWVNGVKITGTIPVREGQTQTLDAGTSITIQAGYYPQPFTITAKDLASQTQGDATEDNIMIDKVAWVNGNKLTGVIPDGDDIEF